MTAHRCSCCTRRAFVQLTADVWLCHECLRPFLLGMEVGKMMGRERAREVYDMEIAEAKAEAEREGAPIPHWILKLKEADE